jgi:hypothetical protein
MHRDGWALLTVSLDDGPAFAPVIPSISWLRIHVCSVRHVVTIFSSQQLQLVAPLPVSELAVTG